MSNFGDCMGAKQGTYPVILIGDEDSCVHRLRWNLDALEETIKRRTGLNCAEDKKDLPTTLSK